MTNEPRCINCGHPEWKHDSDDEFCTGSVRDRVVGLIRCRCRTFVAPAATPTAPAAALRDSLSPMAARNRHRSEDRR